MVPSSPPQPLTPLVQVIKAFERLPHARDLGVWLVLVERSRAVLALDYHGGLVGNPASGVVHGGVITTLLDTACGLAVLSMVPEGVSVATLDLRIDYLRPAVPGREIRAQAECYKVSANVAFVRGTAYHDDARDAIAHGAGTFIVGAAGSPAAAGPPSSGGGSRC